MEQQVLAWIAQYGYLAIFSLLVLGIVGLPVPDDWWPTARTVTTSPTAAWW